MSLMAQNMMVARLITYADMKEQYREQSQKAIA